LERDQVESDLTFAGFAVCNLPLMHLFFSLNIILVMLDDMFILIMWLCWIWWTQVFNCPIRSDSGAVLKELGQSSHDLVYPPIYLVTIYYW
jgi:hypothetical protein